MIDDELIKKALRYPLERTSFAQLGQRYEGKVRDNYTPGNGTRIIIATDRISAFDRVLGTVPLKGQLLNHVAGWWFENTRSIAPNHMLRIADPNVMLTRECEPLPVEMVVRAYLTGTTATSIWVHYERGVRSFCGHRLPDGLRKHERLKQPIVTPSTKAKKGDHDISASREELLELTGIPPAEFDTAAELAMALFAEGQRICAERGLILVDTKYEFGKTKEGDIVVIDEIHTPDSSRFWYARSYEARFAEGNDPENLDKDYVRRFFAEQGYTGNGPVPNMPEEIRVEATRRYLESIEQITGAAFVPNLEEPLQRISRNLNLA